MITHKCPFFRLPIWKKPLWRWKRSWGTFAMTCSTYSTSSWSPRPAMPSPRCSTSRWRATTTATLPRWPLVSCSPDIKVVISRSLSGDAKAAVVDDSQKAYQVRYQDSHVRTLVRYYSNRTPSTSQNQPCSPPIQSGEGHYSWHLIKLGQHLTLSTWLHHYLY